MHEYDKLNQSEIKQIQKNVILEKRVAEFVSRCDIPFSAYYNALYGRRIKVTQKEIILDTLKYFQS